MAVLHTPEDRRAVYEEFAAAGLRPGDGLIQKWYETKASVLGVSPQTIQTWVIREREKELFSRPGMKATVHQLLMHEVDLTNVDAMLTLKECLGASRRVFRMDKDGNTVADYEEPDNQARIQSAEKILKIGGAFTERVDITARAGDDPASKTEAELIEELRNIDGRLTRRALPAPTKTFGVGDADTERELSALDGADPA